MSQLGESISVNGACLTVVAFDANSFEADASNETLVADHARTACPIGAAVNLERAMRPTDRLGGHLVSGHVDGVGQVLDIQHDARAQRWRFAAPSAAAALHRQERFDLRGWRQPDRQCGGRRTASR